MLMQKKLDPRKFHFERKVLLETYSLLIGGFCTTCRSPREKMETSHIFPVGLAFSLTWKKFERETKQHWISWLSRCPSNRNVHHLFHHGKITPHQRSIATKIDRLGIWPGHTWKGAPDQVQRTTKIQRYFPDDGYFPHHTDLPSSLCNTIQGHRFVRYCYPEQYRHWSISEYNV